LDVASIMVGTREEVSVRGKGESSPTRQNECK